MLGGVGDFNSKIIFLCAIKEVKAVMLAWVLVRIMSLDGLPNIDICGEGFIFIPVILETELKKDCQKLYNLGNDQNM